MQSRSTITLNDTIYFDLAFNNREDFGHFIAKKGIINQISTKSILVDDFKKVARHESWKAIWKLDKTAQGCFQLKANVVGGASSNDALSPIFVSRIK